MKCSIWVSTVCKSIHLGVFRIQRVNNKKSRMKSLPENIYLAPGGCVRRWICCCHISLSSTSFMTRQICSIKPEDVAMVRSSKLLAKLELEDLDLMLREGFPVLGMWSVLVEQSEQHVICRLMAGRGRETQANMEETVGERMPWVEAHYSWPSRKEHLDTRCEICYACS